jgi:L-asparaginase/Glu-tRNA(Gln) amidotransferase subunit D
LQAILDLVSKTSKLRALVLQMYGTGNAPAKKDGLLVAIREARARGVVVVWKKTKCRHI